MYAAYILLANEHTCQFKALEMKLRELDLCGSLKEANVAELSTVTYNIVSIVIEQ